MLWLRGQIQNYCVLPGLEKYVTVYHAVPVLASHTIFTLSAQTEHMMEMSCYFVPAHASLPTSRKEFRKRGVKTEQGNKRYEYVNTENSLYEGLQWEFVVNLLFLPYRYTEPLELISVLIQFQCTGSSCRNKCYVNCRHVFRPIMLYEICLTFGMLR